MLIYENTKAGRLQDILADDLVDRINEAYREQGLGGVSGSEERSWRNSFQYIHKVLSGSDVPDGAGIAIEFKIPLTSRRVDLMISGEDKGGNANIVVVELKQWEGSDTAAVESKDGVVETYIGGDIRETTHPSYQAWSYTEFLQDFNVQMQETPINLHPVAYLHNYEQQYRSEIENDHYAPYTEEAPIFLKGEAVAFRNYLEERIQTGDDGQLLRDIADSDLRPSKSLQDSIEKMIEGNREFTLLDSQKVVFEKAINLINRSQQDGQKRVLIVEGEPGTGKTVVAINIVAELLQRDLTAQYVSKNAAPRDVYEQKLRGDMMVKTINHLFKGAGSYVDEEANSIPALVADEAHRLNEESNFFGRGENQILEIINAAQTSVFLIDEDQRVHIDDIGSKAEIKKHARDLDAEVEEIALESQLRCAGSGDYIAWVDSVLGMEEPDRPEALDVDFDVRLFDSPQSLHEAIDKRNEQTDLSRVVAGYCWEWDTEGQSDPDYVDIELGDYERSWNLDSSDPWAIAEGSVDEVGCIHTCQGLEFDYVGVIIGPDLRYEDGEVVTDFRERASSDRSVFGMKKMFKQSPEEAAELADELIKNTYRTLMTRGMQGCYIYCCDDALQEYMRERIAAL